MNDMNEERVWTESWQVRTQVPPNRSCSQGRGSSDGCQGGWVGARLLCNPHCLGPLHQLVVSE